MSGKATPETQAETGQRRGRLGRILDSDIAFSFFRSPMAVISALIVIGFVIVTAFAPVFAPFDPFDPTQIDLWNGKLPPAWMEGGDPRFLLGTDDQGRDLLSTMIYGGRLSLVIALLAMLVGTLVGVTLGVLSGYLGGWVDAIVMRIADVQLTVPAILLAILINGVVRAAFPEFGNRYAVPVVIFSIALTNWPQIARVVRGATLVESRKEYVQAARVIGLPDWLVMARHVVPNVMRPVLVLATLGLALDIISEATLSYLGQGVPITTPSLGTLIRVGQDQLYSGLWWITFFPAIALVTVVFAMNILGDWMRDALNPKLR